MLLLTHAWRILAAGFSFFLFGVGSLLISFFMSFVLYPAPLDKERKRYYARIIVQFASRFFVFVMQSLGLFKHQFIGFDDFPDGGQIIVANHPTLLDAVFLLAVVPNPCCIVKAALVRNVFTSRMIRMLDFISNDIDTIAMIKKGQQVIAEQRNFIIFPEGTRTVMIGQVNFKRGAANLALKANCTIIPIKASCDPIALRKGQSWYDIPKVISTFEYQVMETVLPAQWVDSSQPSSLQARALTRHLESLFQSDIG